MYKTGFPATKGVQWGSEYRTSLVFNWSKVVRSPNGLLFECHLNTGLNFVRYSNGGLNTELPFEYRTSEYQTSESSLFRCFHYSDVCYSDPHCTAEIQKTDIWIKETCELLTLYSDDLNKDLDLYSGHEHLADHRSSVIQMLPWIADKFQMLIYKHGNTAT